jgi:pilus assembly protein Flp/PilA
MVRSRIVQPARHARTFIDSGRKKGDQNMKAIVKRFLSDEKGLETVEYAIITGLIVAGVIASVTAIGIWVAGQFTDLETDIGA